MDYSKVQLEIRQVIEQAVNSYCDGTPVIVFNEEDGVLHGIETLTLIKGGEVSIECFCITGIRRPVFEGGDAPEILEAARRLWMLHGGK